MSSSLPEKKGAESDHGEKDSRPPKLIFAPGNEQQQQQAAQFLSGTLHRSQLYPNPSTQFHSWFNHPELRSQVPETCTLSTAQLPSGRVSSRMVYLKELDSAGRFVVYSNWGTSQKARDLESNSHVALCFWWKPVERQVRVEGRAERLSRQESDIYFQTRARGSKVGAWSSRQSEVLRPLKPRSDYMRSAEDSNENGKEKVSRIVAGGEVGGGNGDDDGRAQLDEWVREVEQKFHGQENIPVPDFWGGLRIVPDMLEFWQGRESRLHDRFRYLKVEPGHGSEEGDWKIERLSP